MAATLQYFFAAFLLCLICQGTSDCSFKDLLIKQEETETLIQSKPEFKVTILNACPCLQANVSIGCKGFQTVEAIDPVSLAKNGDECLLNNGSSMVPFTAQFFNYAWDTQFPFAPLSSVVNCN